MVVPQFFGGCGDLACLIPIAAADSSYNSRFTWIGEADVSYHFVIDGGAFDGVGITFNVIMKEFPIPANDVCTAATAITVLPFKIEATTEGALVDSDAEVCGSVETNGVWYEFVGDGSEVELGVTSNSEVVHYVAVHVFTGDCSDPFCEVVVGPTVNEVNHTWITEIGVKYSFLVSSGQFDLGFPFTIQLFVRSTTLVVYRYAK
jgi:hypothetical protein